jgi:hypothetical protein
MAQDPTTIFPGFPDFQANVTFVPIQFFTIVVPGSSRGTVRTVGYALRNVLGWVDEHGNPTREQLQLTYRELIDQAGVSRDSIAEALREAVERLFLRCVQSPRPDQSGQAAQSGVYELCWDEDGRYTDDPAQFRGFYFPEAAVMEFQDGARTVRRPKAARKNIPNAFFDYLLPRERLSVIRVVGALLFYSIQWGPGGERKVPVSKSITELCRLTRMARRHVHQAVTEARRHSYIEQADGGCFDTAAGKDSRAATYAIQWERSSSATAEEDPVGKGRRSKKGNGTPVRKGERHQSERVNGERSEMGNEIRIKNELKKEQTTATLAEVETVFQLLRKTGFDGRAARRMAQRHPKEVIERQIEWLPLRRATRSRLGLLRRAIEEDWPEPERLEDSGMAAARLFASHYYAGYHDFSGEAATEPFAKDVEIAAKFLPRLLAQVTNDALIPQCGRRFGQLVREKHHGDAKAKPNLSFALVLFGDKFLRLLQNENAARQREALGKSRQAHQQAFAAAYMNYVGLAESRLQESNPALYETFVKHRQRTRNLVMRGPFLPSAERLAQLDSQESRLQDFAAFFKEHTEKRVLSFWEWDARLNQQRFGSKSANLQEDRP